ncbi:MAG: DUF4394 domain-containing protein [Phycisphaerae bacterium]
MQPFAPDVVRRVQTLCVVGVRFPALLLAAALLPAVTPARAQVTIYVFDGSSNLLRFNSAAPQTILITRAITGLQPGENLVGIDFRPATGGLYGVGSSSRLYLIDPQTGVSTQAGTGIFSIPLNGTFFGTDFNPVTDRLRIVSDADVSIRINPDTAAITLDTPLTFAPGDAHAGGNPSVDSVAYTNSVSAGAGATTLFGIDNALDVLVRIGGVDGMPSGNTGQLTTIGPLGVDTGVTCFDIGPDGAAYAALTPGGFSTLNRIDLTTGAATAVGPIGNLVVARGMAVAPVGALEFAESGYSAVEGSTVATISVRRVGGSFGEVTVAYATSDGSATAGSDYAAASGALTFEDGETAKSFNVTIMNDSAQEQPEEVNLTLSSPGGGAVLATRSTAVLTITDNDLPFLPNVTCGVCGVGISAAAPLACAGLVALRRRARRRVANARLTSIPS